MAQIFSRHANSYVKASIVLVLVLVAAIFASADRLSRSTYVTRMDTFREQPIQFSHQHHVGGIGIDCRYCHTSVEKASSAGISPAATCHGRIDRMPLLYQKSSLLMEWCLECHRNPERFVRPREAVYQMDYQPPDNQLELGRQLVKVYDIKSLTTCSTCHR